MNFNKLIISFGILISLFVFKTNYSQVVLSGQVRDNVTHVGISGHQVTILADTSYQNTLYYTKTLFTNSQGYFIDTVYTTANPSKFFLVTLDCNQSPVVDSIFSVFPAPVSLDICTGGINMCSSDFIAYPDTSSFLLIHFFNLSSSNSTSYLWDFGDGSHAVSHNAIHQYSIGSYKVCLTIFDSISNCSDIYCDSITISPTTNCNINFSYSLIGAKKFSFSATVNNIYPTIYSWDFGDFSSANGKNVTHQYQQPGTYKVKVTSTSIHPQSLDTCIANHQEWIQVGGAPTAGIWGQVFADSNRVDSAIAYIYMYDETTNMASFVDSSDIVNVDSLNISYYLFSNLNYGKYIVYLKPSNNSVFAQDFAPAYSGNTIYWDGAKVINLNQASSNLPINLTHLYKLNGTSSISGHVYEGNKASQGNPIGGMPLFLLDNAKVIVDFQYSNTDGSYSFQNLVPQKYFIYSDAINHTIYPADAIITLQNQHLNNINIYISSTVVTSLNDDNTPVEFKIFPNPASQILNIEYINPKDEILNFEITNLLGQHILSKSFYATEGHNFSHIDISQYNSGVYIVSVKSSHNIIYRKKLIITHN